MSVIASFPYLQVTHPLVGRIFEPVVEVTLSHGENRVHHLMFLDSGADISLIPASLGLALGLSQEGQQAASVRSLRTERTGLRMVGTYLQIGDSTAIPVRVGWADDDSVPALLGRLDIFDHYTFEFNHERRMVVVRR